METRVKFRTVVPVIIALVIVFLLLAQRSRNTKSDNSSLIGELREQLQEKEQEITNLRTQHHIEIMNIKKYMGTVKPRHVKITTTLPQVDKTNRLRSFKGHKLIHLDLKGAAPKMAYLLKLLPIVKSWGATGLLVEYEDTFPYDGDLSILKSHYAYSAKEVTEFLREVKNQGLLMVPLVQTFGHMEFVLKHPKFSHLRHVSNMSSAIDPDNKGSLPLVNSIVGQIINMHKNYIKYLHVGGDEVWSLKECPGCQPPNDIYLKHMSPIIDNVLANKITPILWDDMIRTWKVEDLKKIVSRGVEPMVWAYKPNLDEHFPQGMWDRYSQAFPTIWIASAFKGADTPATNFVPIQDRIENHKSWLKIYSKLSDQKVKVNGIALTGWSRYDHYATLCEVLPAGLPSLALCLAVLKEGDISDETAMRVSEQLGFQNRVIFNSRAIPSDLHHRDIDEGTFPGHSVYGLVLVLRRAYNSLESVEKRMPSWFNHRQFVTSEISIFQLTISFQRIDSATRRLRGLTNLVKKTFSIFYNDEMTNEWIWDKIKSKIDRAEAMRKYLKKVHNTTLQTKQLQSQLKRTIT